MQRFASIYTKLASRLSVICLVAAGIGLVAMTVIVAWTVFGRYVLNATPTWGEPASLFLMLWFILLGGAVGVREMDHMGFDIALFYAQGTWKSLLVFVNEALVSLFGLAMVYFGWQLAAKVWSDRIAMIGISKGWDYVPIIVGGVLITLFSVEKLLLQLSGVKAHPMPIFGGSHSAEA
ncbi:MAG: TRAP transporter small permease [Rhabdaerophilum sp.]